MLPYWWVTNKERKEYLTQFPTYPFRLCPGNFASRARFLSVLNPRSGGAIVLQWSDWLSGARARGWEDNGRTVGSPAGGAYLIKRGAEWDAAAKQIMVDFIWRRGRDSSSSSSSSGGGINSIAPHRIIDADRSIVVQAVDGARAYFNAHWQQQQPNDRLFPRATL